jgi:hypothetical protein
VITAVCSLLLLTAWLSHEPSETTLARRRIRAWRRERYRVNPALRRR